MPRNALEMKIGSRIHAGSGFGSESGSENKLKSRIRIPPKLFRIHNTGEEYGLAQFFPPGYAGLNSKHVPHGYSCLQLFITQNTLQNLITIIYNIQYHGVLGPQHVRLNGHDCWSSLHLIRCNAAQRYRVFVHRRGIIL